jgi:hypothetical protein
MNRREVTQKVVFEKREPDGDFTVFTYASYLRPDFADRAMTITVSGSLLRRVFFNSRKFGTAEWINGGGIVECHRWEDEDEAQSPSFLTRMYPSICSDGMLPPDYALKTIIPDVLDNLENIELAATIIKILRRKKVNNFNMSLLG